MFHTKYFKKSELGAVVMGENQYLFHFSCCNCTDYDLETAFSIGIYLPNYF